MSQYEELKARLRSYLPLGDGSLWSRSSSDIASAVERIESLERQLAEKDVEVTQCSTLLDPAHRLVEDLEDAIAGWRLDQKENIDVAFEMQKQLTDVTAQRNSLEGALELMLERIQKPPNRNCSCHISPPCNDCVDFGGEREAFEVAKEALASLNGE